MDQATIDYINWYNAEVKKTRDGHWHPDTVECSTRCPMGDPRTAAIFRKVIDGVYDANYAMAGVSK